MVRHSVGSTATGDASPAGIGRLDHDSQSPDDPAFVTIRSLFGCIPDELVSFSGADILSYSLKVITLAATTVNVELSPSNGGSTSCWCGERHVRHVPILQ